MSTGQDGFFVACQEMRPVVFERMPRTERESLPETMRPDRVAPRVIAVREYVGVMKSEMADTLGVDRSTWTKIEKGERGLPLEAAYKMKLRYGVSLEFLYTGELSGCDARMAEFLWDRFNK
jgi:DNA-binding XRE family transcriptional regulator